MSRRETGSARASSTSWYAIALRRRRSKRGSRSPRCYPQIAERDPLLGRLAAEKGEAWERTLDAVDGAIGALRAAAVPAESLARVGRDERGGTASRARMLLQAIEAVDALLEARSLVDSRGMGSVLAARILAHPAGRVAAAVGAKGVIARFVLEWDGADVAWWRALDVALVRSGGEGTRVELPSFEERIDASRERGPLDGVSEDVARALDAPPRGISDHGAARRSAARGRRPRERRGGGRVPDRDGRRGAGSRGARRREGRASPGAAGRRRSRSRPGSSTTSRWRRFAARSTRRGSRSTTRGAKRRARGSGELRARRPRARRRRASAGSTWRRWHDCATSIRGGSAPSLPRSTISRLRSSVRRRRPPLDARAALEATARASATPAQSREAHRRRGGRVR